MNSFLKTACVPRYASHLSGTLDDAELILSRYPDVRTSNIYVAAVLANEPAVSSFVSSDANLVNAKGGPHGWDALTYLCFSQYLRLDRSRSADFVRIARTLLEAGANANTGWHGTVDHLAAGTVFESALYGAAGIAQHAELTRLLLENGADPNDGETSYHVPESFDNSVLKVLVQSGRLNNESLTTMLLRKADSHDEDGIRFLLDSGVSPNWMTRWRNNAFHQALKRDNHLPIITMMLDHAADPALRDGRDNRSAIAIAARRGRADVLRLLQTRRISFDLHAVDELIAACALGESEDANALVARKPGLVQELKADGGNLLAEFAGNGNVEGIQCLLDLGVRADAVYSQGDPYFDIATSSTALHVAAWRAWPSAVAELIQRGTPVNALDGKGRSALALAVKACVDSYWIDRRSPQSVKALLQAGAAASGIDFPSGYDDVDALLREYLE